MGKSQFSILMAARRAWFFLSASKVYLLRLAALPLALHVATSVGLQVWRPEASVLEAFLWALPANAAFAWFMFAEARYLLLGERIDRLPPDDGYLQDRQRAMRLAVIILLLCSMAFTAVSAWLDWASNPAVLGGNPGVTILTMFLIGAMFWGLRFFVVHILAAVGYPIRAFLARVHGLEFSLRLLGLGLLCACPVYLLLGMALETVFSGAGTLTDAQTTVVILITAPVAFFVPTLLNAAAACALQELLGRGEAVRA
jgi:hypothetical protein